MFFFFFFFKQKTAYEMRISDWSSDVCSSDLQDLQPCAPAVGKHIGVMRLRGAEDFHDTSQQPIHAAAHVHGLNGQPDLVDADHRNSSRNQAPHSWAACAGQFTRACKAPRCNWTSRSEARRVGKEWVRTCRCRWSP